MSEASQVFNESRNMNSTHGQMGINLDYDTVRGYSGCTCPRYFSDKFDLEFSALRHQPGSSFMR